MVFIWPADHQPRRRSSLKGGMVVALHMLVHGLPDTEFMKEVWEADPFWLILIKYHMHMHSLSISQCIAVILNHEGEWAACCCSRSGQLLSWQYQQEKSQEVNARNLSLYSVLVKPHLVHYEEVWRTTYMTWNLHPSRCSEPDWTEPWETCSIRICFEHVVTTDDP